MNTFSVCMNMSILNSLKTLLVLGFMATFQVMLGQTDQEKAFAKAKEAISLMDNGKIDESIVLLREAQNLDPDRFTYPYELAYANYLKKDYKEAIKILEKHKNHKNVTDLLFQLLGNSYDMSGKSDKASETYETGLNKFPKSGSLYLELGTLQLGKKDYDKALQYYEKGIEAAPAFPSNYYWASKIYCSSTEEVWGMIYGELFMNLERKSKRTAEISKLLYDTYKREITFSNDTSFSISFSKNPIMDINAFTNPKTVKLPFGSGVYEPTLILSMLSTKSIDITSLDVIRSNFVDNYFKNGHAENYPNVLFTYQKKIKEAGHMEAYNHWLLMAGSKSDFDKWVTAHQKKFEDFRNWFNANSLQIDESNQFYRAQYK